MYQFLAVLETGVLKARNRFPPSHSMLFLAVRKQRCLGRHFLLQGEEISPPSSPTFSLQQQIPELQLVLEMMLCFVGSRRKSVCEGFCVFAKEYSGIFKSGLKNSK